MLNKEDKADVSRAFGKKAASAVSRATNDRFSSNPFATKYKEKNDAKSKALHSKTGIHKVGKGEFLHTDLKSKKYPYLHEHFGKDRQTISEAKKIKVEDSYKGNSGYAPGKSLTWHLNKTTKRGVSRFKGVISHGTVD